MAGILRKHYRDAAGAVYKQPGVGIILAMGTSVPADASVGYAPGCLFFDVDAAAGAQWYRNDGTLASSDFNAVTGGVDLATLTATAAELNRVADRDQRIVNATAATLAVTEALHDGRVIVLDRAAGIAVTLPAAAAGLDFTFIVKTTFTGAASIKSVAGTDIMIGYALMGNDSDNTIVRWPALAANTYDTIDLFGTANSTGGIAGQIVRIRGLAASLWHVEMCGDAAGTEATPFADTVA